MEPPMLDLAFEKLIQFGRRASAEVSHQRGAMKQDLNEGSRLTLSFQE
jgi:hypothetical protein